MFGKGLTRDVVISYSVSSNCNGYSVVCRYENITGLRGTK